MDESARVTVESSLEDHVYPMRQFDVIDNLLV